MEGGTYAEAIKAGFTREQAVFFTHATIDIKNECWNYFEKKKSHKKDLLIQNLKKILPFGLVFLIGISVGLLCKLQ